MSTPSTSLRRDLARDLVVDMLAERLTDLETSTGTLMSNVGIGDRQFLLSRTRDAMMVRAATSPGREAECVSALASELQRAALYGFTDVESFSVRNSMSAPLSTSSSPPVRRQPTRNMPANMYAITSMAAHSLRRNSITR